MKLNPPNTHVGPDSPASLRFGFFFNASFSGKDGGVVDEMQGWWDGAAQHFAGTSSRSALRGSEAGCNSPPSLHVTLARIGTIILQRLSLKQQISLRAWSRGHGSACSRRGAPAGSYRCE